MKKLSVEHWLAAVKDPHLSDYILTQMFQVAGSKRLALPLSLKKQKIGAAWNRTLVSSCRKLY